ncbi:uncharacterized protein KGF55_002277 [Candida pseudojiufengensis]|uniref:uncharacterized protein n=1 Tax=Candida pseudojiufengensis TaxID=497109 RepID=UPI0022242F52|nr:uncharacterized protein KGF55_002277 [Candida pseudojiufengensis]KAI5964335.1 hypothetical protein KGF55_002277 [Candida pseudojiufengensis]
MFNFESKLQNLIKWIDNKDCLYSQNAKLSSLNPSSATNSSNQSYISSNLVVKDVEGSGRGIYTNATLTSDTKIIRVPHKYLLNFKTVLSALSRYLKNTSVDTGDDEITKVYKLFTLEEFSKLTSFQLLSFYITLEKKRGFSSFWKPFLDTLASEDDFKFMPLYFSDNVFGLLPKTTKKHATIVKTRFERDYELVKNLLLSKNLDKQTVENLLPKSEFLLSWLNINSRCLYMTLPTSHTTEDNFTLAPYIDFINHSDDDQCHMKIDSLGFHVTTSTKYEVGDQIFFNYGPHSNELLLCEYGFIIPHNKWDDLNISEQLISKMSNSQIDFLKDQDYFDNYTLNSEGLSFRTEVCLATLQEPMPGESRKLRALINGIIDNESYRKGNTILIKSILNEIIHESNSHQYLQFSNADNNNDNKQRKQLIGALYKNRSKLAENYLMSI